MWKRIAHIILNNRVLLLVLIVLGTGYMAFLGKDVRMSYIPAKIIPADHPVELEYKEFKSRFGEDGHLLFIGLEQTDLFDYNFFKAWYELGEELKDYEGVEHIMSVPHSFVLEKDTTNKRFNIKDLVETIPKDQVGLDSLKQTFLALPFYDGLLYNKETGATLMAITLAPEVMNSNRRNQAMTKVLNVAKSFEKEQNLKLHYSGLPYLRIIRTTKVVADIQVTLILSVLFAAIILLLLFRSFRVMLFPMLVVLVGVICSTGLVVLLGYELSTLTALMPPLVVVISVPDCVYLINSYHQQLLLHGDQKLALQKSIEKVGYVVFFANLTTAIGFSVFAFMDSQLLHEFGVISGLIISILFFVAIIVVPIMLSFFPAPTGRHIQHVQSPFFQKVLGKITYASLNYPWRIQILSAAVVLISGMGLLQLQTKGFLFDDVPKSSQEYADLKFFEHHFNGTLPFEIVVDTKKKNAATKISILKKMEKVQEIIAADSIFSKPLSLAEGLKFCTQSYYNGKTDFYRLPGNIDKNFIFQYVKGMPTGSGNGLLQSFTDSTQQYSRITVQMADIGSHAFPAVVNKMEAKISKVFDPERYSVKLTGASRISYSGYNYLVNGLVYSVALAFLLIAIVVGYIFRSPKMLIIALLPNIIPLLVTAAIMGYCNIFLKPATVLVFSIAFGISVDFTIHFLAKYRLEVHNNKGNRDEAISTSIYETGLSMLYTAIILFFGFIVFLYSDFEGTFYLGVLTSITIICAIVANLLLLPALLHLSMPATSKTE